MKPRPTFGMVRLTYGFNSPELARKIDGGIAPKLDQHAACELNRTGEPICPRLGAAVDFIIEDDDMEEVARWIIATLPFDRLYFYGRDRPVHVSYSQTPAREAWEMREVGSRRVPRRFLISKLFQPSLKPRRSGMERRNLGSMDGGVLGHPCNLDAGSPCRNDGVAETAC